MDRIGYCFGCFSGKVFNIYVVFCYPEANFAIEKTEPVADRTDSTKVKFSNVYISKKSRIAKQNSLIRDDHQADIHFISGLGSGDHILMLAYDFTCVMNCAHGDLSHATGCPVQNANEFTRCHTSELPLNLLPPVLVKASVLLIPIDLVNIRFFPCKAVHLLLAGACKQS